MILGTINPKRKNVFIDGGGNDGSSVRKFRKKYDIFCRFEIYTFEPNEIYKPNYQGISRHNLIQCALSDKDGEQLFYLDRDDGDGSTLFKDKLTEKNGGYGTLDLLEPVKVKVLNLSNWLLSNFSIKDYIVLKLDVEGAEYDILEKMISDGTINYIRRIFIEWHWEKIGVPFDRHEKILNSLSALGIQVDEWDARGY
ncbi:FkbM family methyltransferase [Geoalkalibacter halelectricus]|uniref:FkbM family methyltransferase n=1 Tax=Geoalkalibacter halelectricus TaxID=2847045 RepID=A0ABY5ZKA2_9BACT|nr:FkbM family methyltransferase [Geoalkalibacter halelectricus]MDO3379582.1 FkbM family methyltransferase [Geoalkalibacter halelectricus]UWZ78169.1 FkbM family methyltransferase [Geoalkalibacter halelectricus]